MLLYITIIYNLFILVRSKIIAIMAIVSFLFQIGKLYSFVSSFRSSYLGFQGVNGFNIRTAQCLIARFSFSVQEMKIIKEFIFNYGSRNYFVEFFNVENIREFINHYDDGHEETVLWDVNGTARIFKMDDRNFRLPNISEKIAILSLINKSYLLQDNIGRLSNGKGDDKDHDFSLANTYVSDYLKKVFSLK